MAPLCVHDLSCHRDGVAILRGVSFNVAPGHALVLQGPNGAGKTTLLRTLAGLRPAAEGQISLPFDQMAYAAHADGLKSTLTARENLMFWAGIFGDGDAENAIEAFGLGKLAERLAGNLSAGQKRRLGLARMLVTGRPVWLLDEPTVSLDTQAQAQFLSVLDVHLAGGGMAILSTHVKLPMQAKVLDLGDFRAKHAMPSDAFGEAIE